MRDRILPFTGTIKNRLSTLGIGSTMKFGNSPVRNIKDKKIWISVSMNTFSEVGERVAAGDFWEVKNEGSFGIFFHYKRGEKGMSETIKEIVMERIKSEDLDEDQAYSVLDGVFQMTEDMWGTDITTLSKTITVSWDQLMPRDKPPAAEGVTIEDVKAKGVIIKSVTEGL